jgi:hypothetical protein
MAKRKLWKVERGGKVWRPKSQVMAYRIVHGETGNWVRTQDPIIRVYVDERDGQGWRLYEVLNLKELPQWYG